MRWQIALLPSSFTTQMWPGAQSSPSTQASPSFGSATHVPVTVTSAALQYVSFGHWLGSESLHVAPLPTAPTHLKPDEPSYAQLSPSLHNVPPGVQTAPSSPDWMLALV